MPVSVNVSNFVIQPRVVWVDECPPFTLDSYEVEKLIEAPLAELQDKQNVYEEEWTLRPQIAPMVAHHVV